MQKLNVIIKYYFYNINIYIDRYIKRENGMEVNIIEKK